MANAELTMPASQKRPSTGPVVNQPLTMGFKRIKPLPFQYEGTATLSRRCAGQDWLGYGYVFVAN